MRIIVPVTGIPLCANEFDRLKPAAQRPLRRYPPPAAQHGGVEIAKIHGVHQIAVTVEAAQFRSQIGRASCRERV